jgi:hypothetical protein
MITTINNQQNLSHDVESFFTEKVESLEPISNQVNLSGLHEKQANADFDMQRKKISSKLSPIAYALSSAYHVVSGIALATGFVKSDSNFVKNATRLTKTINSLVYGDLAIDAWQGKQSFDFISKVLEPTLNCFSQLSNYHLLRGLGSAMTQLHLVNFPHIEADKTMWENFMANMQETKRFFVEAWTSPLFGPNRRLGKFSNDKGHTLAWLSHIQGVSGILGLLNGSRRNMIDKIVGTVRNVIGVGVDVELLFNDDLDKKKTGQYYLVHAIFDTMKRFLPKENADALDNLIMPFYNKAMYHFGKITRNQSNESSKSTVELDENYQLMKRRKLNDMPYASVA